MKTILNKRTLVTLLIINLLAIASFAQSTLTLRSNTEGFHIGLNGSYKHWTSSFFNKLDETEPMGLGGGINIGYGINQHFELLASYDAHTFKFKNEWDDYTISAVGIGVRYNFGGTLQAIRPFAEVAYNYQNLYISPVSLNGELIEYELKGGAIAFGAGINFFVTPKFAIQARGGANLGKFSTFLVDGEGIEDRPDIKTFQFGIGINYYFN